MSQEERNNFIKENLPAIKHDETYFEHLNNVDKIAAKYNLPTNSLKKLDDLEFESLKINSD